MEREVIGMGWGSSVHGFDWVSWCKVCLGAQERSVAVQWGGVWGGDVVIK